MVHNFGPYSPGEEAKSEDGVRKDHFQYYKKGIVTSERVMEPGDKQGIIHMLEGLTNEEKLDYVQS